MKRLIAAALILAAVGCSSKPCVDGERTSQSGYFAFSATRTSYDPCKQKCCSPDWKPGCACSRRYPY